MTLGYANEIVRKKVTRIASPEFNGNIARSVQAWPDLAYENYSETIRFLDA
jgi:hypothetical protein